MLFRHGIDLFVMINYWLVETRIVDVDYSMVTIYIMVIWLLPDHGLVINI
jgi:hypothetical protein